MENLIDTHLRLKISPPSGQTKCDSKIYLCLGNLQRHMPLHDPTGNAKKKALELKVGR